MHDGFTYRASSCQQCSDITTVASPAPPDFTCLPCNARLPDPPREFAIKDMNGDAVDEASGPFTEGDDLLLNCEVVGDETHLTAIMLHLGRKKEGSESVATSPPSASPLMDARVTAT